MSFSRCFGWFWTSQNATWSCWTGCFTFSFISFHLFCWAHIFLGMICTMQSARSIRQIWSSLQPAVQKLGSPLLLTFEGEEGVARCWEKWTSCQWWITLSTFAVSTLETWACFCESFDLPWMSETTIPPTLPQTQPIVVATMGEDGWPSRLHCLVLHTRPFLGAWSGQILKRKNLGQPNVHFIFSPPLPHTHLTKDLQNLKFWME